MAALIENDRPQRAYKTLAEGSAFLFLSVLKNKDKENLALTPAQMTSNLHTHWHPAAMVNRRYTLHSVRVGAAASHVMDFAAVDVLKEYVGRRFAAIAGRYVRGTATAATSRGMKRLRERHS